MARSPHPDTVKRRHLLAAALCLLAPLAASAGDAPAPLATIESLDVPRYMGRWHEIARYPNRFQRQCVGDSSADYQLQPDNTVRVTNRCRLADGSLNEAIGQARQLGGPTSPRLEVRFAPAWLSFIPAVWGDYWVVEIDDDYRWVVVSEPSRRFLWVLARTPTLDARTEGDIRTRLVARGFDPEKLVSGRQDDDR